MSELATIISVLTLVVHGVIFVVSARKLPEGALSLPCITVLTSTVYFYLMPILLLAKGNPVFFGLRLESLELVHMAVLLYVVGALVAFVLSRRTLLVDPTELRRWERETNPIMF